MKENIIISVESRKGGVGKTTAALCVGKILLEKGYAVLLIDTDITGTNIADCVESPFWHDCLNILKVNSSEDKEESKANLLSLFGDNYMNGKELPSFQRSSIKKGFDVDLTKINIIGSQIYSSDGKPTTICSPAIIFDQLHGYWFVDFLKELTEDFAKTINSKQVAVILDNSPGYVGIAPAIQDWLTDVGPEVGKFLMVTSLDSQDMQSCAMAISVLHEWYREKWNTSRMFIKAKNGNGDNLDYSLMKGAFFVKLAEYEDIPSNNESEFAESFAFYNDSNNRGIEYTEKPEKYIGVIVNRVPKTVIKHRRTYKPIFYRYEYPFLNLLGGSYSREWSKHMVGYDPYIEYQFLQSGISTRRQRNKSSNSLNNLLMHKEDMCYDLTTDMSLPDSFNRISDQLKKFQNIIDTSIDAIRTNGLDYLADLIDEDWLPKNIIANLQAAFYNFMINADYSLFKEKNIGPLGDRKVTEEMRLYRVQKILNTFDVSFGVVLDYPEIRNIIIYLIASLPVPLGRNDIIEKETADLFRGIIMVEMKLIKELDEYRYNDLSRILSSDFKQKMNLKDIVHKFKLSNRLFYHSENEFLDFFHAFTSAQARLMKLKEDSQFLIWLIHIMVEFERKTPKALPYIRKIAEDVIIHKTLSYDAVKEKSSNALSDAQYFADFDKVIKNIVNHWGFAV